MTTSLRPLKATCAAVLLACASWSAQAAAVLTFDGVVDSGSLVGSAYSGSFSFEEPAPSFDGTLTLNSFQLTFFGQTYTLADADTTPLALFSAGQFLGLDYTDADGTDPALRPFVSLTAGFTALSEAFFAYDTTGSGPEGFGNFNPVAQQSQVPEPASLGLALAGLGGLGGLFVWRRRGAR